MKKLKDSVPLPDIIPQSCLHVFYVLFLTVLTIPASAQKNMVQVKTFDQQLQPYGNIEISINDKDYISMGNKGSAFIELSENELPLKSVKIKNEQLEAASWNYSKGIVQIIVRKKSYQIHHLTLKDPDNKTLANLKVTFKGKQTITATTNANGQFDIPLALDERISAATQFSIAGYNMVRLQLSETENVLTVDAIKADPIADLPVIKKPAGAQEYFKDFDLSKLDSIQSLTVFYAIFKDHPIREMSPDAQQRIDAKFNELVRQLGDSSARRADAPFIGKISDSSFVDDDIKNLLAQAQLENQTLDVHRTDFDDKLRMINDKLASGMENLDAVTRNKLLSDLTLLERLLVENESRFYKNQNDYRSLINALKEKFFDFQNLEDRLSESEKQRQEEQRLFRQRLLAISGVVLLFAMLILLLIYFGLKLRKQKKALSVANAEVKSMNENLEGLVTQRTRLLAEAHKELDTFLYRASHDLRSPICSIIGLCNIASHISRDESKELFEKAGQTAFAMDRLLKKLRIISEINNPSDFSRIALAPLVEDLKSKFDDKIYEHGIKFSIKCPDELIFYSYPVLMKAILFNLIENAIFYSVLRKNDIPEVQFQVSANDDNLVLSIYDNGIGVNENISQKLFDMFYKGNELSKGNGLGLYIVKKSVEALDGSINVESEVGLFTKFVVALPLRTAMVGQSQEADHEVLQEL